MAKDTLQTKLSQNKASPKKNLRIRIGWAKIFACHKHKDRVEMIENVWDKSGWSWQEDLIISLTPLPS